MLPVAATDLTAKVPISAIVPPRPCGATCAGLKRGTKA